jgi:hypothetical protein
MFEPLISLTILNRPLVLRPGDVLRWEFQIDAVEKDQVQAVETSALWYTEGKGDEDIGVHFFKRCVKADVEDEDLRALQRYETILPHSPLSYDGSLVKIRWCVRVRVFLSQRKQIHFQQAFRLVQPVKAAVVNPMLQSA